METVKNDIDFVMHVCKKCDRAFVAEDYTNVQVDPPHWRYCPHCAKELGIDYEKQKPWRNFSESKRKQIENLKEASKKSQFKTKPKH